MRALAFGLVALLAAAAPASAAALDSVRVTSDAIAIDLTHAFRTYAAKGDALSVPTAPGADGVSRMIEVSALRAGGHARWIAFALTNDTGQQVERLLVAPHYRMAGSGVVWPDLGGRRIVAVTASQGFAPRRTASQDADVFTLTLDPGSTVTYVAELGQPDVPQLYLWRPDAFQTATRELTFYQGVVIGVIGLLALFLTIVFVVRGAVVFPAAAALAWTALAYACIDFGFWRRMFGGTDATDAIWRAGAEAMLSATLIVFLFSYLNLSRWHVRYSRVTAAWIVAALALAALAVWNAPVAAGVARMSLAAVAVLGLMLVVYLATHGSERALMLIPAWIAWLGWIFAAALTVLGAVRNDFVEPALMGALTLVILLVALTVFQYAIAAGGLTPGALGDKDRKALALIGSGDVEFDWDVPGDHVHVGPEATQLLGLKRGALEGPASAWLELLHPFDRDRYAAALDGLLESRRGRINIDFRLRAVDGHHHWFTLKARPVVGG
ncbi:MAG: PAS domain-containing protein, partial [Hyphomicrobiales bacterium]|nr:PAS domain-containing protein [Hyphomicrobiales bacterium]